MEKFICSNCNHENSEKSKYCTRCGHELPRKQELVVEQVEIKSKKRKISISQMVGIGVGILLMGLVQRYFATKFGFEKVLMEVASEINKNCPFMVDSETRLDNAISIPGNVFQYNYTLINKEKSQVDTTAVKSYLLPRVTNDVKTNPRMETLRKHKVTMCYYYKDKVGKYLFSINVSPKEYN